MGLVALGGPNGREYGGCVAHTDLPDSLPDELVTAYGREARRVVLRSHRLRRIAAWEARLAGFAMVVAAIALLGALALLVIVLPVLGVPLVAVTAVVGAIVLAEWAMTRFSSSGRR